MTSRKTRRPNILFVLTDDQGAWALGCAGNPEIRTPNLDALAARGVRCENMFCASPVCSPARASILTGRIPSRHGVHDWIRQGNSRARPQHGTKLIEYLQNQRAFPDLAADAGYNCGLSGKWHLGNGYKPQKSFSFWNVHAEGGGPYYGAPMIRNGKDYTEKRYVTEAITENALRFLEDSRSRNAPFLLAVHYTAPHAPWDRSHHPARWFDPYFESCAFQSVPDEPIHPWHLKRSGQVAENPERRRELLSG